MPPRNLPGTTDRRIDALLTLLSENPMIVISGQKIAREIGVSRSSVWRWTQKLRALGVRVKGHPRAGYQIERVPDVLSPSLLRRGCAIRSSASASTTISRLARPTPSPWSWAKPASRTAPSSWPKSKPPGAAAPGAHGTLKKPAASTSPSCCGRAISPLLAPLIPMVAGLAVRDAVLRGNRARPGPALAQRPAAGGQEILRHPRPRCTPSRTACIS